MWKTSDTPANASVKRRPSYSRKWTLRTAARMPAKCHKRILIAYLDPRIDQSTAAPCGAVGCFLFIGHAPSRNAHLRLACSKFAVAFCERNRMAWRLRVGIGL